MHEFTLFILTVVLTHYPLYAAEAEPNAKAEIEALQTQLAQNAVAYLRSMEAEHENNVRNLADTTDTEHVKLIAKGFYYAFEYSLALERWNKLFLRDYLLKEHNFYYGMLGGDNFERIPNPAGEDLTSYFMMGFRLRPGTSPYEALQNLSETYNVIDCLTAVFIAYYHAIATALGKDKFDYIFRIGGPFGFSMHKIKSSLGLFLTKRSVSSINEVRVGQLVHFRNCSLYSQKHVVGVDNAFNTLCSEAGKEPAFIGFGISSMGLSQVQIKDTLLAAYNKKALPLELTIAPTHVSKVRAAHRFIDILKDHTFDSHRALFGNKTPDGTIETREEEIGALVKDVIWELDADKIYQLINAATKEDAEHLMLSW